MVFRPFSRIQLIDRDTESIEFRLFGTRESGTARGGRCGPSSKVTLCWHVRITPTGVTIDSNGAMRDQRTEFRYLTLISGLFVATVLVSNTIAQKPVRWGLLTAPAAVILFPLSYIFGDVLTEVYGYARTRQVIWTGLIANLLMVIAYELAIALPAASFWTQQEAMRSVLGTVPRVVLASYVGYLAGEFVNSFVLAKMKLLTKGRYLWTRTVGSTIAGQFIDTALFVLVGFIGVWPRNQLLRVTLSLYGLKVGYEILATPLTYAMVAFLKRTEDVDHYDIATPFTPFRWRV